MGMFLLVLASILACQLSTIEAQIKYVTSGCDGSEFNYTEGSVYESNLNLLLSQLTPKSASVKYYNSTAGVGPDEVYGLYQCREDVSLRICNQCIKEATQKIIEDCPLSGDAAAWYYECTLWYAHNDIVSSYVTYPGAFQWSTANVSNYDEYAQIIVDALESVIKNASLSMPHFAHGETNLTLLQQLYTFAQCTPGLDFSGCNNCLENARTDMYQHSEGKVYASTFFPSCQLRYAMAPFLNLPSTPASPPPDNDQVPGKSHTTSLSSAIIGAIAAGGLVGLLVFAFVLWFCFFRKKPKQEATRDVVFASPTSPSTGDSTAKITADNLTDTEFVQYDFITLRTATIDFSPENKLGEGGFGSVYKGLLANGKQLAIKRLSATARQGDKQFMTEARLLAKLQHRNLVKLFGFCSEGDERLLIYEFMPNSSLDCFLFDARKRSYLDWPLRNKIIMGIARGLQYLHEDSRLTIIHRDLKPANILLDKEMNPKIADFGLAKLFGGAQKYGNTESIVGTQGYMAPEYAMTGDYSDKSDVYSFGIMLLEILSGQRNRVISRSQPREDLSIQTWRLWNKQRSFEITDPILLNNCSSKEVKRCIQIGLICVQANPEKRPTMAAVVVMLTGSVDLPLPSAPVMSSNQQNSMPMNYSGAQQSDVERYSTQSSPMQTDMGQDLYPAPR